MAAKPISPTHHTHKTAPGPPRQTAVATPTVMRRETVARLDEFVNPKY
ncbi:hypothetical protein GCM10022214_49850 [Actinomadura miaoliensis]|uniref:Uncharacterized protein n=1 Tax=Actinomadura miaoliensis TaxID=430685 RepID=A0ABP7W9B1_9ACTN